MAYIRKIISKTQFWAPHMRLLKSYSAASNHLVLSEEVSQAKIEGKPIVALESTIITHGMPYPQNLETALEVENIIRQKGVTPATVAILNGQLTVGLTDAQIRYLAQASGAVKASRRDLAPIIAARLDGATTVAGTLVAAELADIPIFVTGGIGGVHRNGENTMDISADLTELGRSKALVVCSGVKSILDIGKTLEYLETQGVCVCTFGNSDEFPAFYTRRSGHSSPYHAANAEYAARLLHASRSLLLGSGIVMAVPVPEEHAMDENIIEEAIKIALEEAAKEGIQGKEVTPYILAAVSRATAGASLTTNIALIKNNAKVGADIAVEYNKVIQTDSAKRKSNIGTSNAAGKYPQNFQRNFHTLSSCRTNKKEFIDIYNAPMYSFRDCEGDVLVIGGSNVDRTYRVTEEQIQLDGSTHACKTSQCGGGVGRNIAEALWRLRSGRVRLLTAVADDADGQYLKDIAPGLLLEGCVIKGARTPIYAAVMDAKGECRLGLGDMGLHNVITTDLVNTHMKVLEKAPLVVLDGNAPQTTIDHVLQQCHRLQKPVFFEPTDRRKAVKGLRSNHPITFASPNFSELRAMAFFLEPHVNINKSSDLIELLELSKIVLKSVETLIVTLGHKGVAVIRHGNSVKIRSSEIMGRLYQVELVKNVENVSGAGDCLASGIIHGVLLGLNESSCVSAGIEAAKCALLSGNTIPSNIKISDVKKEAKYITL